MAGKRHHFIPQFLQRGFASPGETHNAWVFHKERPPFNTTIKNIGLEGQFYALEGNTSVDDKITNIEGALAAFVAKLRRAEDGTIVDSERAAELITHTLLRTRHVRQNFQRTNEELLVRTYSALADPETLIKVMEHHIQQDDNLSRLLREMLALQLTNTVPAEHIEQAIETLLPHFLERARAEIPAEIRRTAKQQAKSLKMEGRLALESPLLKESIKNAHLKALGHTSKPNARQLELSELNFRIRKFNQGEIILGDSVAIYGVKAERRVAPLNDTTMPMMGVLLPLDPETCLIGYSEEPCECFSTAESIRKSIAQCCLEFFIAHRDSPENHQLLSDIGTNSHLLSKGDINEIMKDLQLLNDRNSS